MVVILDVKAAGHGSPRAVKFSPDGKWIATVTDSSLVLYDAPTLHEVWAIKTGIGEEIAFAPNSAILVAVLHDTTVRVYDVVDGTEKAVLLNPGETIYSDAKIVFSPDGSLLASGTDNGAIEIWQVADWKEHYTLSGHEAGIANLIFSSDDSTLISVDDSAIPVDVGKPKYSTIRTWQLSDKSLLHTIAPSHYLAPVGIAAEGRTLLLSTYIGSQTWLLNIYQVTDTDLVFVKTLGWSGQGFDTRGGGVFSYDEALLAIGDHKRVGVYSIHDPVTRQLFDLQSGYAVSIAIAPDYRTLATVSSDEVIRLWPITL